MDRLVEAKVCGKKRYFNYSIEVLFKVVEKFGSAQKALDSILKNTKESFETVCWLTVEMVNDGELCRREQGHDKTPFLTKKELSARMSPAEFEALREAVTEAIKLGYQREKDEEDEEIDLGLQELEEKKEKAGE